MLENVPVPEVDHVIDVAPPPLVPVTDTVDEEQIVLSTPAVTVAGAYMLTIIPAESTLGQFEGAIPKVLTV